MARKSKTEADGAPEAMQDFEAVFNVVTGDGSFEPGAQVSLTREDYDDLKAQGAIKGEWVEAEAK